MAKATSCTLSPERLRQRLAWIRDEILLYARRSEPLPDGLAWELEAAPGLVEKLDRLVELERACCDGVEIVRKEGAQPGWIRLEVRGLSR